MPLYVCNPELENLNPDVLALPYCQNLYEYYQKNYYYSKRLIDIYAKLYNKNRLIYFNNQTVILDGIKDWMKNIIKHVADNNEEPIPRLEKDLQYLEKLEVSDNEILQKFKTNEDNSEDIIDEFDSTIRNRNRVIECEEYVEIPVKDLQLTIEKELDRQFILLNYKVTKNFYFDSFLKDTYKHIIKLAIERKLYNVAIPIINLEYNSSHHSIEIAIRAVREIIKETSEDINVYLLLTDYKNNYYSDYKIEEEKFIGYKYEYEYEEEPVKEETSNRTEERDENYRFNQNISCCYDIEELPKKKKRLDSFIKERIEKNKNDLDKLIKERMEDNKNETFSEMVIRKIEEKHINRVECYKAANVNKNIFSKIIKEVNKDENDDGTLYVYHPDKKIVFAFIIALKLNIIEAEELLKKAGFAFTNSTLDIIVQIFIEKEIYDIDFVNQYLFRYRQSLLGTISRD